MRRRNQDLKSGDIPKRGHVLTLELVFDIFSAILKCEKNLLNLANLNN